MTRLEIAILAYAVLIAILLLAGLSHGGRPN